MATLHGLPDPARARLRVPRPGMARAVDVPALLTTHRRLLLEALVISADSVIKGAMFTVLPHKLPHGPSCGRWHCRILGSPQDGKCTAQQMKIENGRWSRGMSTRIYIAFLTDLEVQLDLFGDPVTNTKKTRSRDLANPDRA